MTLSGRCERLPRGARRLLALVVTPVLISTFLSMVYLPARALYVSQQGWRAETRGLFSKAKQAEQRSAMLGQQFAALQSSGLWSKFYLSATPGAAANNLQSDIGSMLSRVQVGAQSLVPLPSTELAHFSSIGVRVSASMRIDQLSGLLTAMAQHPRYLRVAQASIVAPQIQSATENPPLAVTLDLYGFELRDDIKPRLDGLGELAKNTVN